MGIFKAIRAIVYANLSRWGHDIRVRFILLFTILLLFWLLRPLTAYSLDMGCGTCVFVLPLLFNSNTVAIGSPSILLHFGFLLLLCDAPFFYPGKDYMIMRSGRRSWCLAECGYILTVSFLYISMIAVVSVLFILPAVSLHNSWGGSVRDMIFGSETLTAAEIGAAYPHTPLPEAVIRYMKPFTAAVYTYLSAWGSFSVLGLLMYLVSLASGKMLYGLSASAVVVFMDPILVWYAWPRKYWMLAFSPVSWTSAGQLDIIQPDHFISMPYVAGAILGMTVFLCLAICRCGRRIVISTLEGRND